MVTPDVPPISGYRSTSPGNFLPTPSRTPMQNRRTPQGDTINVSPTIQKIRNQITQDLSQRKSFHAPCLDYLLSLLTNVLPPLTLVLKSDFLVMDIGAKGISNLKADKFLAPIYHTADSPHWTLISVSKECEGSSNRPYFRALHYDSKPDRQRNADVERMLNLWKERHYGGMELRFGLINGPTHEQRYMSGRFVIMAATEFAMSGTIKLTNPQKWNDDAGKLIRDLLNKHTAPHQQPSPPKEYETPYKNPEAQLRPESTPSRNSPKRQPGSEKRSHIDDVLGKPSQTPESSHERPGQTSTSPETSNRGRPYNTRTGSKRERSQTPHAHKSTMSIAGSITKLVSKFKSPVEACEPGSKKLRNESNERSEPTLSAEDEERAGEDKLLKLRQTLVAELRRIKERRKEEDRLVSQIKQQFEEKNTESSKATKEHELAQATVDKQQEDKSNMIANFPLSKYLARERIADKVAALYDDEVMSASKRNLEDKSGRKRKAEQELASVTEALRKQTALAISAESDEWTAEEKAQEACKEVDWVAIVYREKRELASHWEERKRKKDWLADWEEERRRKGRRIV